MQESPGSGAPFDVEHVSTIAQVLLTNKGAGTEDPRVAVVQCQTQL